MDKIRNNISRLEQYNRDFQRALTNFSFDYLYPSCGADVARMLRALSRIYDVLANVSVALSDIARDSPANGLCLPCESEEVYIMITASELIVRIPNLVSKYSAFSRTHAAEYSSVFAAEVREKMAAADVSIDFTEKHITILGVYRDDARKIPDADNLDTKAIVDAITRYLPGGDDWEHCTFSNANIKSDRLKSGTYFIVSPSYQEPPSMTLLISRLEQQLGKH